MLSLCSTQTCLVAIVFSCVYRGNRTTNIVLMIVMKPVVLSVRLKQDARLITAVDGLDDAPITLHQNCVMDCTAQKNISLT